MAFQGLNELVATRWSAPPPEGRAKDLLVAMEEMWREVQLRVPVPDYIVVRMVRVTRRWRGKKFNYWRLPFWIEEWASRTS